MPVVDFEFRSPAIRAGGLHLRVKALPSLLRISVNPLPALVENHGLANGRFRGFFYPEFQLLGFVAVAARAVSTSFKTKITVEAEFHELN